MNRRDFILCGAACTLLGCRTKEPRPPSPPPEDMKHYTIEFDLDREHVERLKRYAEEHDLADEQTALHWILHKALKKELKQ